MKRIADIGYTEAFKIGFFQCLSLCPGVSRSAATILGGMYLGINRATAAQFSFLLAVPSMCAAVGYDMLKSFQLLSKDDIAIFGVGFIVSFIVALLTVKFLIEFLKRSTLKIFGVYRILFGAVVFYLWFGGLL